jgi:hypothetical protein
MGNCSMERVLVPVSLLRKSSSLLEYNQTICLSYLCLIRQLTYEEKLTTAWPSTIFPQGPSLFLL